MKKILAFFATFFVNGAQTVAGANPMTELAIFAVEEAIKDTPSLVKDFKALFSETPTAATFAAFRAKVAGDSYAKLVPASQLPPDENDLAVAAATTPPAPTPEVKSETTLAAAPVVACLTCGKELISDHPANCNCPAA